jgi:hypothetical protein
MKCFGSYKNSRTVTAVKQNIFTVSEYFGTIFFYSIDRIVYSIRVFYLLTLLKSFSNYAGKTL